ALLHDLAVLAMVEPKFLPPIQMFFEHFQFAGAHTVKHDHQTGLDTDRAILELRVCVPDELDGSERVVPSVVHSADARPMAGKVTMLASDLGFLDREYPPAPKYGYAFRASFQFVFRVARNDPRFLFVRKMGNVINRHERDVTIRRLLVQE